MTRDELLKSLSEVEFCAVPTLMTEDMGLEYDYITPKGAGSSFGNIGDWPAFKLCKIDDQKWKNIKEQVANHSLTDSDLEGTELGRLVESLRYFYGDLYTKYYPDLSTLFAGVLSLPDQLPEYYYCRMDCRSWGDIPDFFSDKKSFLEFFEASYCSDITEWNDMTDAELQMWLDRTEEDLDCFPFQMFEEDED